MFNQIYITMKDELLINSELTFKGDPPGDGGSQADPPGEEDQ